MNKLLIAFCLAGHFSLFAQLDDQTDMIFAYSIEETLENPAKVGSLYLTDIEIFPKEILKLTNLESLILNSCGFNFPDEIKKLENLARLKLINSNSIPVGMHNFKNLSCLHLAGGELKSFSSVDLSKLSIDKLTIQSTSESRIIPNNISELNCDSLEIVFFQDLSVFKELFNNNKYFNFVSIGFYESEIIPDFVFQTKNVTKIRIHDSSSRISFTMASQSLRCIEFCNSQVFCLPLNEMKKISKIVLDNVLRSDNCGVSIEDYDNVEVR